MNFNNIQMAVVKKKYDGIKINISEINEENRNEDYECIMCGSDVIPIVPKGKTIDGYDAKVTPHFKHLNSSKCNSESFMHFWCKTEFIKIGDKFNVFTNKENEYICNQIFFEKAINVGNKKYIPDATIYTSCGSIIHFEFNYTNNKKIKDYIDIWKNLNNVIVEIDLNIMTSVFFDKIPEFKALYYDGKCFNLNAEDNSYYNTIGKYKLTKKDKNILNNRKIEIEKLDWLWDEMRNIKNENFEDVGKLLQSIKTKEGKNIAIEILRKSKCGNNFINNYVNFIKNKIDKRLKLLNLKYNGCSIKYDIRTPRLIYDRIFRGIIIRFYAPEWYLFDTYYNDVYTFNYNFDKNIINDEFKLKVNPIIKNITKTHNLILHIIKTLESNNKIVDSKFYYKENTDYIESVCFKDYRNKYFIIFEGGFYNEINSLKYKDIFNNYVDNESVSFINLYDTFNLNNIFIIETENSYYLNTCVTVKYKFEKIFKQNKVRITYKFINNSFKYLSKWNFIQKIDLLYNVKHEIDLLINNYIKIRDNSKIYNELITNEEINQKIKAILYPMIYVSNNSNQEDLKIILNKSFEMRDFTYMSPWTIKDFIEILENLGIKDIKKIV